MVYPPQRSWLPYFDSLGWCNAPLPFCLPGKLVFPASPRSRPPPCAPAEFVSWEVDPNLCPRRVGCTPPPNGHPACLWGPPSREVRLPPWTHHIGMPTILPAQGFDVFIWSWRLPPPHLRSCTHQFAKLNSTFALAEVVAA